MLRPFVASSIPTQRTGALPPLRKRRPGPSLTENGLAFLKCAFASPDFSVDPGKGIPDRFHGRTLAIKDCNTTALEFEKGTDTYILVAPVPGYAYFRASVPIGDDPVRFVGTRFPTFETNFGNGFDAQIKFSKFRYASMAAGLYPTSNMMQFSGSVQVWRVDLNLAEALKTGPLGANTPYNTDASVVAKRIQGLQGVVSLAPRDNYSNSFIKGAYTFAFDKTEDFQWQDFCSGQIYQEFGGPVTDTSIRSLVPTLTPTNTNLPGLGNVNTLVFKISTPADAVNTAILRVWNCLELQPDTNSALFQFSGVSPEHDPMALELYNQLKMRFPVAMPCDENAKFWEHVLRLIRTVSAAGMLLPGPYGLLAGGVNTAASALASLVL